MRIVLLVAITDDHPCDVNEVIEFQTSNRCIDDKGSGRPIEVMLTGKL
ncbi:hypothetical protein FP2506_05336 [Fulvimarina pelagi HTCC2506]|uniref:Uncharacterized protein n=1 Tax=Fulvimarina pelagi HTCC2506 TaxID=314231 RepID=Q0G7X9_9HYPH|nr:hypothetical protein FP2506_05336 [Fulvimarina pelagi HTCC2506]